MSDRALTQLRKVLEDRVLRLVLVAVWTGRQDEDATAESSLEGVIAAVVIVSISRYIILGAGFISLVNKAAAGDDGC